MRLPRRHRLGGALAFALLLGSAGHARAQSSGTAKVAAETLFEEGRRLMTDGKLAEACPKFAESQRLDPSSSTLLNLASCYEKTDRPATAWATYKEAASSASAANRQDLVATAQRHADALYPTLPRLNLSVAAPVDGMTVSLDGTSVGRAEWGIAVPVDPGDHTIDASAPHFKPWTNKVTVGRDPTTVAVAVPALEAAPPDATPPPAPAPAPAAPPPAPVDDGSAGRPQRTIGIVLGAVGVVGLAVGAGFAISAKNTYNSSLADCLPSSPNQCSNAGVNQRNSAISAGNVASVAVAVGAVAVAAGVVLWVTAPSGSARSTQSASIALVPTLGGGMVSGSW
jgi:hypothetical protein